MDEHGVLRVRLLGEFQVWRADGSEVTPDQWRTGKTRDLLRLLAMNNGHVVRPVGLIDKLWPDVSEDRARNSLRTATSRIRSATRTSCVARRLHGIVLLDAWVDTIEFRDLGRRAHLAARAGQHRQVLDLCSAAEELYGGDFEAYDDESLWANDERDELRRVRREMLTEGAEAALEIRSFHEAVDLASVVVSDPWASESAHRTLMRAHAALGDVASALRVFEACRARLAEEFGVDPSRHTQELHLSLLRGLGA